MRRGCSSSSRCSWSGHLTRWNADLMGFEATQTHQCWRQGVLRSACPACLGSSPPPPLTSTHQSQFSGRSASCITSWGRFSALWEQKETDQKPEGARSACTRRLLLMDGWD